MSKELAKTYDPSGIEDRLYQKWLDKKYFHAEVDHSKTPFTIVIPPPNITGQLHMGHALDNTMQDILIRYKRMQGYNALWQPGTDHASIATEVKIIQKLKEEGIDKHDLGREKFLERAWVSHPANHRFIEQRQFTACAIREYLQIGIKLSGGMSPVRGSLLTGTIGFHKVDKLID